MPITVYGASDDLVEVDGCEGADEFNVYGDHWQGDLMLSVAEQMRVHCWYDDDGCWQVGVGQVIEDVQLPAWPVTITQKAGHSGPGYSALLTIDAPEGTKLVNIKPAPVAAVFTYYAF